MMLQPSPCGHDQNRKVKNTRASLTFVVGRLAGLSLMCDSCILLAAEAVTDRRKWQCWAASPCHCELRWCISREVHVRLWHRVSKPFEFLILSEAHASVFNLSCNCRVKPLLVHLRLRQLRWFRCLVRMPPGLLPSEVFQTRPGTRTHYSRPINRIVKCFWWGGCLLSRLLPQPSFR